MVMKENNTAGWEEAARIHSEAISNYIKLAELLDDTAWKEPVSVGKWTPVEITEHLRSTYEILIREQESGVGLRPRAGFLLRTFLRLTILPGIYKKRRLPAGAKAPAEIRPVTCIEDKTEALQQLREFGERFASLLGAKKDDPDVRLTHHLFGEFTPAKGLEFVTIHLENHIKQLPNLNE